MPMARIVLMCCQQLRLLADFKQEMEVFLCINSQKPDSLKDVTPTKWHRMRLCVALILDPKLGSALRR